MNACLDAARPERLLSIELYVPGRADAFAGVHLHTPNRSESSKYRGGLLVLPTARRLRATISVQAAAAPGACHSASSDRRERES